MAQTVTDSTPNPSGSGTTPLPDTTGTKPPTLSEVAAKGVIMECASKICKHLKKLPRIMRDSELQLEVNKLNDYTFLRYLAWNEHKDKFASVSTLSTRLMAAYNIGPEEISKDSVIFVQSCMSVMMEVFKTKVFV